MAPIRKIPITVLVGASEKALLNDMPLKGVAVVEVDQGAAKIDHDLVVGASVTPNEEGCICCGVAGNDLAEILETLFWQRLQRKLDFDRVLIVSPVAIHGELFARALIAERFAFEAMVTPEGRYINHRKLLGFRWAKLAKISGE
ncbi:MAG TPA: GTP-binding protein [Paraburkholderia sp.]|jgi:G3E family GTPase